jgi:hypothetical protein
MKEPSMASLAEDIGFSGLNALATLQKFLSKYPTLEAWMFHDSAHHLRKNQGIQYKAMCGHALKAFQKRHEDFKQHVPEKEKAEWTITDYRLRFVVRFMEFATQPREIWAAERNYSGALPQGNVVPIIHRERDEEVDCILNDQEDDGKGNGGVRS